MHRVRLGDDAGRWRGPSFSGPATRVGERGLVEAFVKIFEADGRGGGVLSCEGLGNRIGRLAVEEL